jgi:hypothetical protein
MPRLWFNSCDTHRSVKICCWNTEGLTSEKLSKKLLGNYFQDFDILLISETWGLKDSPLKISDFKHYPYPREKLDKNAKRGSGGISVYVKTNLSKYIYPISNYFDNLVWMGIKSELTGTTKPLAIATCYFPPIGSTHNCDKEDYFNKLEIDCAKLKENFHIIACGDLNARIMTTTDIPMSITGTEGDLENLLTQNIESSEFGHDSFPEYMKAPRVSQDMTRSNEYGTKLLEFCKGSSMRILNGRAFNDKNVGKFTRIESTGCSVIDYVICDVQASKIINDFKVDTKTPESDHCPLVFSIKIQHSTGISAVQKGENAYKYKWNQQSAQQVGEALVGENSMCDLKVFYDNIANLQDVNCIASSWSNYFIGAVDQTCIKAKCINRSADRAPWVDDECTALRNKVLVERHIETKINLTKQYQKVKQQKKRQFKNVVREKLSDSCGKNSKVFWETVKSLPSAQTNNMISNPETVCKQLQELSCMPDEPYFDKQFEQLAEDFLKKYDQDELDIFVDKLELEVLNNNFSIEEIECAIQKLKNKKSPGLDLIPAEFIKYNSHHVKNHLMVLYNYILTKGEYPNKWAEGLRVAIPKGESEIRPITIEPVFGKILETAIDNRLSFINEAFLKNDKYNGGFLKGSRTQDNMLILLGCIQKQLLLGKCLYVAFVDFRKAFNYINRKILFYKIIKSGKLGRTINLLRNMFNKTRARVKINGSFYDWITDLCGTNQGGPVSPNMFRVMLSDLKEFFHAKHGIVISEIEILTHILWADDLVITCECEQGLQEQLNGLSLFCSKFQMIVNEDKTKVVIFGQRTGNEKFSFNGKTIDIVEKYKYLGSIFNTIFRSSGNPCREMPTYLAEKALKASFATLKKVSSAGFITPQIGLHLFDTCVLPILEYGTEIWGNGKLNDKIERIQLRYLKMILGVKDSTCTVAVYGELGRFPILLRQKVKIIQYWLRLQAMPDNIIVKQIYNMLKQFDALGYKSWATTVKSILYEYGFEDYWQKTYISRCESYKCACDIKEAIYNKYKNNWYCTLQNYSSMRSYMYFKSDFCMESYLLNISDRKIRKVLSKFRLSSHSLLIEKGRHTKPKTPEELRLCKMCDINVVENEQHMLTECVLYKDLREVLFNMIKTHEPALLIGNIFLNIMKCKNTQVQFCIGKYLQKSFKLREDTIKANTLSPSMD